MVAFATSLFPLVDTTSCFDQYESLETFYIEDLRKDMAVRRRIKAKIDLNPAVSPALCTFNEMLRHRPNCMESMTNKLYRAELFR